jgi:hypothetical protein
MKNRDEVKKLAEREELRVIQIEGEAQEALASEIAADAAKYGDDRTKIVEREAAQAIDESG